MKCFFVGVFNKKSTNYSQSQCLKKIGNFVYDFEYRKIANEVGREERDKKLIIEVIQYQPDFVLISKGNTIDISTICELNKYSKTVLWYMDSMNSNWNYELLQKIKHCDVVVCGLNKPFAEALKINTNAHFINEGYDPEVDKSINIKKKYNISFIGQLDGERKKYYNEVQFHNLKGYSEDHAKLVSQTMINLNFVRNGAGCSDRVYKILAAKGFLLTQPWLDMENDFNKGVDLDTFTSVDELKEKIKYYFFNKNDREKIIEQGYKTVQKFSRINWAKKIINIFEE